MTFTTHYLVPFAAILAISLPGASAFAQDNPRSSTTVVNTERGPTTVTRSTQSGDNGREGSVVVSGPTGQSTTRDFSRSYQQGLGVTSSSTVTGFNGRARTTERGVRRVAPGQVERNRQVTGLRGNERNERRWVRSRSPR